MPGRGTEENQGEVSTVNQSQSLPSEALKVFLETECT